MKTLQVTYEFIAAVLWEGTSVTSGHYTAVVQLDSRWFLCNDNVVIYYMTSTAFHGLQLPYTVLTAEHGQLLVHCSYEFSGLSLRSSHYLFVCISCSLCRYVSRYIVITVSNSGGIESMYAMHIIAHI